MMLRHLVSGSKKRAVYAMSEELKLCPFCDGEAVVIEEKKENITEIYIMCTKCFCKTDTYISVNGRDNEECIEYAVEDWNRRVENKRVKQACEYLEKCLKTLTLMTEEMTSLEGDIMSFLEDVAEEE